MKYLIYQSIIFLISVTLLFYFSTLEYFLPTDANGDINSYNVIMVVGTIFFAIQSFVGLFIFLTQKFLAFGWKEFPPLRSPLKWGLVVATGVAIIMVLNIFTLANPFWIIFVVILCIITIVVI